MLTCFIRNQYEDNEWGKIITLWCLLILPILCFGFSIYAFIKIFRRRKIQENKEFRLVMIKYLIYSALFIVFYFPTPVLYTTSVNGNIQEKSHRSWFAFVIIVYNIKFCVLGNVTINVVLSLFRIIEGYVRFDWKAFCFHKDLDGGDVENRRATLTEVLVTDPDISSESSHDKRKRPTSFKSKFNILSITGKSGVNNQ